MGNSFKLYATNNEEEQYDETKEETADGIFAVSSNGSDITNGVLQTDNGGVRSSCI